eukprot:jgi/Botrbrau1/15261/Bobra.0382s0003.1
MQQIYPGPKDKCVSRSVSPTCGEPGYIALLCDALASTTRRMTRGHPFGHFMNILYCEASRSTTCVKTHAHTCRRARGALLTQNFQELSEKKALKMVLVRTRLGFPVAASGKLWQMILLHSERSSMQQVRSVSVSVQGV